MNESRSNHHTSRSRHRLLVLPLFLGAVLLGAPATSDDGAGLAAQIARLRMEVDDLSTQVEAKKEETRGQLRSYANQKVELEMELQREELRLRQLLVEKEKRTALVGEGDERESRLRPVVLASIDVVRRSVARNMPFQMEERLEELDRLRSQIEQNTMRPSDAVARLWDRVEDELRLARENGIYRQVAVVNGKEMLVDVARIGMAMMYFRTKDEQYGHLVRQGNGWSYELFLDKRHKEQVAFLFDSFKKQIRTGFFVLPGGSLGGEVSR